MTDRGTVLVVDDELESLRLLTEILQAEGYRVLPAEARVARRTAEPVITNRQLRIELAEL